MTNPFDVSILRWINQFALCSRRFGGAVLYVNGSSITQGQAISATVAFLWFSPGASRPRKREILVATVAAAFAAILAGRALGHLLPFRVRPAYAPDLNFVKPLGGTAADWQMLRSWSSFPSDHAMLFSAVATGLFFISKPLGLAAQAYWLLLVAGPRLFLGFHYPTDILGGAVLGMAIALVANRERVRSAIAGPVLACCERNPSAFYAGFFLLLFQIGTMFDEVKALAVAVLRLLR